jgi:Lsr2
MGGLRKVAKRFVLVCDPHKTEDGQDHDAVKTRTLALDGDAVEVDLCPDYDNQVTALFALMRRSGRPVELVRPKISRGPREKGRPGESQEIRMWCAKQDPPIKVNDRGRIPADIKARYYAARRQSDAL